MNELMRSVLAIVAIIIIALALSASTNGAKLVQAGLLIAIVVVVLKNSNAVQNSARDFTKLVARTPAKSTGP